MANTLSTTIDCSLRWALASDTPTLSPNITDASRVDFSKSIANGTAVNLADLVWYDSRTLTAAANDDLDLTALTRTIFGTTVSVNMAKVKAIIVVVTTTTTAYRLRFDSSVANGFTGHTGASATSKIEVGADSAYLGMNKVDGWAVSGTTKILRINNPSAGTVAYKIAIIGTSA